MEVIGVENNNLYSNKKTNNSTKQYGEVSWKWKREGEGVLRIELERENMSHTMLQFPV